MSAPIIWIVTPFLMSLFAFFFRKQRLLAVLFTGGICTFLAILALTVRIDSIFPMGPLKIEIPSELILFGRSLIINDGDRYLVALLYAMGAIWFFGSRIAGVNEYFVPNSMAIISLLIAAISVQPFLFDALIVEMAVLISIPTLLQKESNDNVGIFRFLVIQTLAVPFILLAGWGFEQAAVSANAQQLYYFSAILLGFGFSMWLAVFPFYTWVPLLAESGHPFVAGFIFAIIPATAQIILVDFFNNYSWLRTEPVITGVTQTAGILMIVIPGIWAVYQKSILRLFGYLVLVEVGFAVLSFSVNTHLAWEAYFSSLLPRVVGIALCSMAITTWKNQDITLNIDSLKGLFFSQPISVISFLVGWFSLSGLPLFPMFPIRFGILTQLSQNNLPAAIWAIVATFGLFFTSMRLISVFFTRPEHNEFQLKETPVQSIFLGIGSVLLLLMGLFPNIYVRIFLETLSVYKNLP
ncbi:MAG: hypothetical protein BGO78_04575 [Chloroflexi bacterium 44-23]|nr:MAG: hypothetical protein BGO78_04575 [Chloroflexi bacterium 44-23]